MFAPKRETKQIESKKGQWAQPSPESTPAPASQSTETNSQNPSGSWPRYPGMSSANPSADDRDNSSSLLLMAHSAEKGQLEQEHLPNPKNLFLQFE